MTHAVSAVVLALNGMVLIVNSGLYWAIRRRRSCRFCDPVTMLIHEVDCRNPNRKTDTEVTADR